MRPRKASGSDWGRLAGSWEALGLSEGLLGGSWGALGWHGGPLESQVAKMLIFQRFGSPGRAATPPTSVRAGAVEGVRGRHKSLPQRTWIRIWDL